MSPKEDQKFIFNKAYGIIGALLLIIGALVTHIYTDTQTSIKNIERHTAHIPLILERVSINTSDIAENEKNIIQHAERLSKLESRYDRIIGAN
jgi:predicted RNA-binding protein with PIN domain